MSGFRFLSEDGIPVEFAARCIGALGRERKDLKVLIAERRERLLPECTGKGVIVFFKLFLLEDMVLSLKGIEQMKQDGAIQLIVPDLNEIDACIAVKQRVVEVKARTILQDVVPITCVETEPAAGCDKRIHLPQCAGNIGVFHVAERAAAADDKIELSPGPDGKLAEISLMQFGGKATRVELLRTGSKHRLTEIGAAEGDVKLKRGERDAAGANADIQHGVNLLSGKKRVPVFTVDSLTVGRIEQIIELSSVIDAGHGAASFRELLYFLYYIAFWFCLQVVRGCDILSKKASEGRSMEMQERVAGVIAALKAEYPDALCALQYKKDYELMIAVRLSAQCTDARVNLVTPGLFARFPTLDAFADADIADVEECVRSCGFYKHKARDIVLACQMLRDEYGGKVPDKMEDLLRLPGVGRKTANLLLGDLYGEPGSVVCDTHCIRICNLLGLASGKEPEKVERQLRAILPPEESSDFCHRIVLHGRAVCIARRPRCEACALAPYCRTFSGE